MSMIRGFTMAAAVVVTTGMAAQAQAQGNAPTPDQLVARAQALHETPAQWGVAASLYARAAQEYAPNDPASVEALRMAGRLFTYAGELGRGRDAMEKAAQRALSTGDVVTAATAYADAVFIAASDHSKRTADLARRVIWLADSERVPADLREEIRFRIGAQAIIALRHEAGLTSGA